MTGQTASALFAAASGADPWGTVVFSGALVAAIPVAILAGLVSFASPCVLPLVPGYLGYLSGLASSSTRPMRAVTAAPKVGAPKVGAPATALAGQQFLAHAGDSVHVQEPDIDRRRLLGGVMLFIVGFSAVFIALGVFFGTAGQFLRSWDSVIERVLGVVVIVMGLAFIGAVPSLQRTARINMPAQTGLWGAPLMGMAFGLGWTPCLGPTLTAINALALDGGSALRGGILACAYCIGLGLPFIVVALGVGFSRRIVGFMQRHRVVIMRIGGIVLVLLGLALVTGAWGYLSGQLQWWISGYETAI